MPDENTTTQNTGKYSISKLVTNIAKIAPLLYIIGFLYHQGYLLAFGTGLDMFPKTSEEYLMTSFWVFTNSFTYLISGAIENFLQITMLFTAYVSLLVLLFKNQGFLKSIFSRLGTNKKISKVFKPTIFLGIAFAAPLILIYILAIVLLLTISPYLYGNHVANKIKNEAISCDMKDLTKSEYCTFVYENGKETARGKLIDKSKEYIAIWDGLELKLRPIKDATVIVKFGTSEGKSASKK